MKAIRNKLTMSHWGDKTTVTITLDGISKSWELPSDFGYALQKSIAGMQKQNAAIYRAVKRKER